MFKFITIFISVLLYAHPHCFIEVYPKVTIQNNKTQNITFTWKIDEMTSTALMAEIDTNKDNKLDKQENSYIKDNYFMSLKSSHFYTYIKNKKKEIPFKITNFLASFKNGKVNYTFSIKTRTPVPIKNLNIYFYDTDFFVAMILKKEFLEKNSPFEVKDYDGDYYFGYILKGK